MIIFLDVAQAANNKVIETRNVVITAQRQLKRQWKKQGGRNREMSQRERSKEAEEEQHIVAQAVHNRRISSSEEGLGEIEATE
ncbi:hypothetical protein HAX54_020010 [Datura stramonium]|uniref:Uncharacterized protein n=1 Tax=Datura stramonium TaxID=4076 RepID=A0ABS8S272_DATST|nr:hypothetical protein [Datura stramonium]